MVSSRPLLLALLLCLAATVVSCRGMYQIEGLATAASCAQARSADAGTRVVVLILDNQWFDAVYRNPAAPFFNSLIPQGAFAENYYGSTWPSIGNYLMLNSGAIPTNDNLFSGVVLDDNVVRECCNSGVSWKAYMDGLPEPGYIGDKAYPYVRPHNPFSYFGDVFYSKDIARHMVPLDQLFADLDSGALPSYSWITPSQVHNMHDCPLDRRPCDNDVKVAAGDGFLKEVVPRILASPAFQRNGLLIITTDHAWKSRIDHGGGHVVWLALGPRAKKGYRSATFYQHPSTVRLIADLLGIKPVGAAAQAPAMTEFLAEPAPAPAP